MQVPSFTAYLIKGTHALEFQLCTLLTYNNQIYLLLCQAINIFSLLLPGPSRIHYVVRIYCMHSFVCVDDVLYVTLLICQNFIMPVSFA